MEAPPRGALIQTLAARIFQPCRAESGTISAIAVALLAVAGSAGAGTYQAALLKDILPGVDGSGPTDFADIDGTVYFTADDGVHGAELWKSNGAPAGTVLVKDINPGTNFGGPTDFTDVDGTLYFSADDGTNGVELWRTHKDSTAPAGGKITTSLPVFARSPALNLSWGGATDSGSGVAAYDLYVQRAAYYRGFTMPSSFETTAGPASTTFGALRGSTYCFFVRVSDTVGNTSAPSTSECTAVPADDSDLSGEGWTKRSGRFGYYLRTYKQSSTRGATLTLSRRAKAKRISLLAVVCPGCGAVSVFQGSKLLKHVDLGASTVETGSSRSPSSLQSIPARYGSRSRALASR